MSNAWIPSLRSEIQRDYDAKSHIWWNNLPNEVYDKYVDELEWLYDLTEDEVSMFLLLVCEAES